MLYLIGLGLIPKHITKEGEKALHESSKIYVEAYTSLYSEGNIDDLEKIIGKKVELVYRNDVENNLNQIIKEAENEIVSFCVYGNITSATTHSAIINECISRNIDFKLIPGISIFSVVPMLSGLQEYRFGRTISIVKPLDNYKPSSFFDYIIENKSLGLHTLCLLDIKIEKDKKTYLMQPYEASTRLIEIANEKEVNINDWECVVVSGACGQNQIVFKTTLSKLKEFVSDFDWPSCLVILGKTQEDEKEMLKNIDSY